MFYIPKEKYKELTKGILLNDFKIELDMETYKAKQNDEDFLENGIDIEKIPETMKVEIINNKNINNDALKDILSDACTQYDLIKYYTPHIMTNIYNYAVSNIFDSPKDIQNQKISEQCKKLLNGIFAEKEIPKPIMNDMFARFVSDKEMLKNPNNNDFKHKIFAKFLTANLKENMFDTIYGIKGIDTEWKNIMSKNPYNQSKGFDNYANETIQKYLSETEFVKVFRQQTLLMHMVQSAKLNSDTIQVILDNKLKKTTLAESEWLERLILSENTPKETIELIKKESPNDRVKLLADTVLNVSKEDKMRLYYFEGKELFSKYHYVNEESKKDAKILYDIISDTLSKEDSSSPYAYFLRNTQILLITKFKLEKDLSEVVSKPTNSANTLLEDLSKNITEKINSMDKNYENVVDFYSKLNLIESSVKELIEQTKETYRNINKTKTEEIKEKTDDKEISI